MIYYAILIERHISTSKLLINEFSYNSFKPVFETTEKDPLMNTFEILVTLRGVLFNFPGKPEIHRNRDTKMRKKLQEDH